MERRLIVVCTMKIDGQPVVRLAKVSLPWIVDVRDSDASSDSLKRP